ncbi:hypothetical protein VNO78_21895 [Psophocarpus tetragonolobus]|uniref:Myb-like domain-containing protein n=1 Tax=Psophocarpus tetragonolobus TaxID=3891 RepID=A0AAN9SH70_PSOTE
MDKKAKKKGRKDVEVMNSNVADDGVQFLDDNIESKMEKRKKYDDQGKQTMKKKKSDAESQDEDYKEFKNNEDKDGIKSKKKEEKKKKKKLSEERKSNKYSQFESNEGGDDDQDWDNLLDHRPGDVCRKRWNQMVRCIGEHGGKSFAEQVEVLAKRYCPDLLEAREAFDAKPVVHYEHPHRKPFLGTSYLIGANLWASSPPSAAVFRLNTIAPRSGIHTEHEQNLTRKEQYVSVCQIPLSTLKLLASASE